MRSIWSRACLLVSLFVVAAAFLTIIATATSISSDRPTWNVPSDPQEKREYDLAHGLRIPYEAPLEAWNAMHERIRIDTVPEPQPFDFWLARFKALLPGHPNVALQYYEHLCDTEAGEYVFRKAKGVDGIFQMRPRRQATARQLSDLYGMEDPYGYNRGEADTPANLYLDVAKFRFFETRLEPSRAADGAAAPPANPRYRPRFYRYWSAPSFYNDYERPIFGESAETLRSRYGFVWRGLHRPWDRKFGIAGGEFLIVDLRDNSVMALQRGFALRAPNSGSWDITHMCPRYKLVRGPSNASSYKLERFFSSFVRYVLRG